jgi:hypothetical protein
MYSNSPLIDRIIEAPDNSTSDIVRFCASDRVSVNIFDVLKNNCPADYARDISKNASETLFSKFGKHLEIKYPNLPQDIKQEWVFDTVLEAGTYLRIASLRKTTPSDVEKLLKAIVPFGLILEVNNHQIGKYSGLVNFRKNMSVILQDSPIRRHNLSIGIIDRLVETVGSIEDSTWIFHNSLWKDTLSKIDKGFFILKAFLHTAILAHTLTEAGCLELIEVSRETVLNDVASFISLKEDPSASVKDLKKFFSTIEHYITDIPVNRLAFLAFAKSQEEFKLAHYQNFGNLFDSREFLTLPEEIDLPEWKFLRELGDDCSAEVVIFSEEYPVCHAEFLVNNHLIKLCSSPYAQTCKDNNITIPTSSPKSQITAKVALTDRIYSSIVKRRFLTFHDNDLELAHVYNQEKSHILLVIEDPTYQMRGLSLFNESLTFHMTSLKETFFEREWEILEYFQEQWNALKLFKPNKMKKSWKSFFNDRENRYTVRQFLFKLIESLYLEKDDEFKFQFDMTRFEFFNVIETLATMMSQEANEEDLIQFFESVPHLKQMMNITQMDQNLWTAPYRYLA